MGFQTINPASGQCLQRFDAWDEQQLATALDEASRAAPAWAATPLAQRCARLRDCAGVLRSRRDALAALITLEMGKLLSEARAEVDKCALVCDYYAEHSARFLADEHITTDARRSFITYQPLGTVLAVMPWNFPLWQVFRFAAPALAAGNTGLLKHASNVPQCALAIESVIREAGFPAGVFRTLMIGAAQVEGVIADPRVRAVTLTGSENAGRKVAAAAGAHLKKTVLELGGADACVVLDDADLDRAVAVAVTSRYLNAGQSCIAAKRFIVVEAVLEDFTERFISAAAALNAGDPTDPATRLAPLAREDLRAGLNAQVLSSIQRGAVAAQGCRPLDGPGFFYPASVLTHVAPGMPAFDEELFGPVAAIIRARDEAHALKLANHSRFGLGGSVWTADPKRGETFARRVESGACFVNGLVKSDPRLPFGGIKTSGYGRELAHLGMREFQNAKTVWVG
ncbi:MAG TPA: NAD-dependent succinate-semialdehyde dehydrogenase [Gammaproteobacteria bacterium]|nr:NAD-dependent succinate-semialdehyde dehydrogenase [Gammaproteobacteria bacterium]